MLTKFQPRFPSMVRWNPFEEMSNARRLMDQPFEALFAGNPFTAELAWRPLADVSETKEGFTVSVELPGMKQEEIVVSVEENVLTVKGERKRENQANEEGYSRVERFHGSFERHFTFPGTVDMERIQATYRDGILEIRLPKKEEAKPKTVKIQTV
jgi:HSP20 family protein